MSDFERALLLVERWGLIDLLNFYQYRLEIEGPVPQIMPTTNDLLDMLFDTDERLNDKSNESEASDESTTP